MDQHGFAENATITQLSHFSLYLALALSAGMSVKDKLSDYLTEIDLTKGLNESDVQVSL